MQYFGDVNELIRFSKGFLDERVASLERDVAKCLAQEPHAPFPALLYAFALIDLLGALLAGDGIGKTCTTKNAKAYMERFMHYSQEQRELLMNLFRHKVVHLAQPKAVIKYGGKQISWGLWSNAQDHHLKLVQLPATASERLTSKWTITWDYRFEVSVFHLVKDIRDSVYEPEGYLHALKRDQAVQDNFGKAIHEILNS